MIHHFTSHEQVEVAAVYTNKASAGVVERAKGLDTTVRVWINDDFQDGQEVVKALREDQADWVILAGFLRKIPSSILKSFTGKIINIHPSLLPKYGGKGMYGAHVHKAVIENFEAESGITIHLVNEVYDEGEIIAQFKTEIAKGETAASLEEKIKVLEHAHFPPTVESYILNQE